MQQWVCRSGVPLSVPSCRNATGACPGQGWGVQGVPVSIPWGEWLSASCFCSCLRSCPAVPSPAHQQQLPMVCVCVYGRGVVSAGTQVPPQPLPLLWDGCPAPPSPGAGVGGSWAPAGLCSVPSGLRPPTEAEASERTASAPLPRALGLSLPLPSPLCPVLGGGCRVSRTQRLCPEPFVLLHKGLEPRGAGWVSSLGQGLPV